MLRKLYRAAVGLIALLVFSAGSTGRSLAIFMFQSESAIFEPLTNKVQFTIQFNQPPNFSTVDSMGRQANSFQYFIVGDPGLPYPSKYDSIIRGEEIHLITAGMLRIRNSVPPDPGPVAVTGGWGSIRGEVPFNVNGNTLTFSTPLSLISNNSLDGSFAYRLETSVFGGDPFQFVESQSTVAAEPATGTITATGAILLLFWYGLMRRRNPQWS